MVCVLDFKREVGLWHAVLTVSLSSFCQSLVFDGWMDGWSWMGCQ